MSIDNKAVLELINQNWQEPLLFDWEGKNGPNPITEEDIINSGLHHLMNNESFPPPWESESEEEAFDIRKYIDYNDLEKGWFSRLAERVQRSQSRLQNLNRGRTKQKRYPRVSSLTKLQHLSGLKVLSEHYGVQCPLPTPEDIQSFEEIKEVYETEQEKYREWARICWINTDYIRALNLNPIVETVYKTQFVLKKNEIQSIGQDTYTRAGYLSLEARMNAFELKPVEVLKNVDVQILPNISYNFERSYRRMHTYYVPKPCLKHPCRFILPRENNVTDLWLPEVHYQLAHFAMENRAQFVASENALQCLLERERSWKLPVSIAEVVCPDGGGVKTVAVIGSTFSLKKECGALRTFDSFRHLLRDLFAIYPEDSREANLSSHSDEGELPINVDGQRRLSMESPEIPIDDEYYSDAPNESDISYSDSEQNQLVIDDEASVPVMPDGNGVKTVAGEGSPQKECGPERPHSLPDLRRKTYAVYTEDSQEARPISHSDEEELPRNVDGQRRRSMESPEIPIDDEYYSDAPNESDISYSDSEQNQLVIDDEASVSVMPDGDGVKTVAGEGSPQKECGPERTHSQPYHRRKTYAVYTEDSQEARPISHSDEEELPRNVNGQRRRSMESPEIPIDDEYYSDAPNESDISYSDSEQNQLVIDDEASVPVMPDGDGVKTVAGEGSPQKECGPEHPHSLPDLRRKTYTVYTEDSRQARLISHSVEELPINDDGQRRRSMDSPEIPIDDEYYSDAPNESDISYSDSEQNQLVIADEASIPVKRDNYETEAVVTRNPNFSLYFGSDSDEDTESELCFQPEAEVEVAVPNEEQNQNNFAAENTEIENAQTSNQIPLDTATLPTSNENSSSGGSEFCYTCKCAMSGEPSPRSFKKWKVTNAATQGSHNVIVHCSHKFRDGEKEVILEPIVEWQPELGACEQSAGRLRAVALALMMRPKAELMNVRMEHEEGNIIAIDKLDEEMFMRRHGDKRSEIADTIHKAFDQLLFLRPGQYILAYESGRGPTAMIYAAQEKNTGCSEDKLSLFRSEKELSNAEETELSKIPPTLTLAMLPYHTEQEVLPLAFTTDKRRVVGYKSKKGKKKRARAQASQAEKKRKKRERDASCNLVPASVCERIQEILPMAFTKDKRRVVTYNTIKGKKKVARAVAQASQAKKNRKRERDATVETQHSKDE